MDGSLRWMVRQHPPWHIAMPGAGAIHPINGGPWLSVDERVNAFLSRPLEGAWPYLWLDATYVKVREGGRIVSRAVIVAVAVNEDGKREVLGVTTGPSEAETCLGPGSCVRWPTAACGA